VNGQDKKVEVAATQSNVEAVPAAKARHGESRRSSSAQLLYRYAMLAVFLVLFVVMTIASPTFRNPQNLANLLQQNSIIGIVACGMVVMIISGGFDLSVGAVGAMSAVSGAAVFINMPDLPLGPFPAVVTAIFVATMCGLLNGVLIGKVGINPFVTTLGTQTLIRGVLLIITDGKPIYGVPNYFNWVGLGKLGPIPFAVIMWAAVILLTMFVLRSTRFGHYVYAVGGNANAARLAGINVDRTMIGIFAFGGFCAGTAGVLALGTTLVAQPTAAETWPLTAIAAVVVGGVPLSGGSGGVWAAVLGTLLLGTVANALNLLGVSPFWQPAVTGLVILIAVGLDSYQRKRRATE
jgi:ribose/xylose/arabinose/galactoside ABC-type transport system permease subunit